MVKVATASIVFVVGGDGFRSGKNISCSRMSSLPCCKGRSCLVLAFRGAQLAEGVLVGKRGEGVVRRLADGTSMRAFTWTQNKEYL